MKCPARVLRCVVLLVCLLAADTAQAQIMAQAVRADMPAVTRISPLGINPGQAAEFTLAGDRLADIQGILCPGGVELEKVVEATGKLAKLRLKARNDAVPGIHVLHVVTKSGLSNPRLLRIDRYAQVIEKEEAATPDKAQPLTLPAAVTGTMQQTDEDMYKFEAAAGQRLVIDVEAYRLGLPVRPVIALFDAQRHELARMLTPSADVSPDARLVHSFAEAGTYYVRLHDRVYQGGELSGYYLRIGEESFASEMFPLGGRRGETVEVMLGGAGLAQSVKHRVDLTGDARWQSQRLVVPTAQGTLISPMLFAAGDYPETAEQEPNDKPEQASDVSTPITINGRIAKPGDRDTFRFQAKSGSKIAVRVRARELGSPLDPVISIRDLKGKVLATADDSQSGDRSPPAVRPVQMPQTLDDPRLEFTVPADGQYLVTIDDLYYHGGGSYGYRLELAPPRPEFEALVQPGRVVAANAKQPQNKQPTPNNFAGQGTGALTIDRGSRGTLAVKIIRQGYTGPVQLSAEGLPPGVTVGDATIAAGQPQGEMVFNASFDASNQAALVRIYATAEINGQKVVRRAEHPVLFAAAPLGVVTMHHLDTVAIAVSGQGAELGLKSDIAAATVAPGSKVKVTLSVRRREGLKGEVIVKAASLPEGLTLPEVKIPDGKDAAEVELAAGLDAKPGKRSLQLQASLKVKGQNNPVVAESSVSIEVQSLVALELAEEKLDLPVGGKKSVQIKISRQTKGGDAIDLETSRLPDGVTIKPLKIAADAATVMVEFAAARSAEPTTVRRVIELRPRTKVNGQTLELPTLRIALKVVKP